MPARGFVRKTLERQGELWLARRGGEGVPSGQERGQGSSVDRHGSAGTSASGAEARGRWPPDRLGEVLASIPGCFPFWGSLR